MICGAALLENALELTFELLVPSMSKGALSGAGSVARKHEVCYADEIPEGDVHRRRRRPSVGIFNTTRVYPANAARPRAAALQGRGEGFVRAASRGEFEFEREGEILRCRGTAGSSSRRPARSVFNPPRSGCAATRCPSNQGGGSCRGAAEKKDPSIETYPVRWRPRRRRAADVYLTL
jgi:hypothetical protein